MLADNEIKADVSPFAVKKDEIKTFDGQDRYISMDHIVYRIDVGHINDIHFKILEIVNDFEFVTSRQIYQILEHRGEDIKTQDKLNKKLEQLVRTKILTRYYFTSEEGKCTYKIYCLEKMGKYLLDAREVECKWQQSNNIKPVEMIKKRLAGNQIIIAYLRKVKAFDSYTIKPAIKAKKTGKLFKASGGVKLTKNSKVIDFVFEAVRREEGWEKKLTDRMKLYIDFFESFITFDSGYEIKPQLILVCEDDRHMAEAFKEIVTSSVELPNQTLYYTTDLRQNSITLDKSLVEFKLDSQTGKYKMEEIEIKLLK